MTHTPHVPSRLSDPVEISSGIASGQPRRLGRTALIGLCAGAVALSTTMTTAVVSAAADDSAGQGLRDAEPSSVEALAVAPPQVIELRPTPQRASRSARTVAPAPTKLVWRTKAIGRTFRGEASWYGPGFQGRTTANGERYDMHALTAAHKTLPFGTRLEVCRGDRCVVVRINDRGPFVGDRVLDLSKAAAQQLGYSGVATVSATPVRRTQVRVAA